MTLVGGAEIRFLLTVLQSFQHVLIPWLRTNCPLGGPFLVNLVDMIGVPKNMIMSTAVEYRGTPLTRVSQRSSISWLLHTQRASFPDRLELEIADMFVCLRFSRHAILTFLRASHSPTICWCIPSLIYMSIEARV